MTSGHVISNLGDFTHLLLVFRAMFISYESRMRFQIGAGICAVPTVDAVATSEVI